MGCRAQQQALGVGNQGAEVGHSAHAKENQAGINAQLDAEIQVVDQAGRDGAAVGQSRSAECRPVDVPSVKQFAVEHVGAGQVGQQHAEGDRQQQQRLELFDNGQIGQETGNREHNQRLPVVGQQSKAGLL